MYEKTYVTYDYEEGRTGRLVECSDGFVYYKHTEILEMFRIIGRGDGSQFVWVVSIPPGRKIDDYRYPEKAQTLIFLEKQSYKEYFSDRPEIMDIFAAGVAGRYITFNKIPYSMRSYDLCLLALKAKPKIFHKYPREYISQEVCTIAFKRYTKNFRYIPSKYVTKDMLRNLPNALGKFIPERFKNLPVSINGFQSSDQIGQNSVVTAEHNVFAFEYLPESSKTEKVCRDTIKKCGMLLRYVPEKFMTREMCIMAVSNDGLALEHVPVKYIGIDICEIATNNNWEAFGLIPNSILDICDDDYFLKFIVKYPIHLSDWIPYRIWTHCPTLLTDRIMSILGIVFKRRAKKMRPALFRIKKNESH